MHLLLTLIKDKCQQLLSIHSNIQLLQAHKGLEHLELEILPTYKEDESTLV